MASAPESAPPAPVDGGRGLALDRRANALLPGSMLAEFEITSLIGEGGFGIVYLAIDHTLGRQVAIKEYLPARIAARNDDGEVSVRSERHADTFAAGLRSFLNEARLLARFDHPALVKVYRYWQAQGTAYMVMPYYRGVTLARALRRLDGPPTEAWLRALLEPLLDALSLMHAEHCYHRDIAPDNILMLPDGRPLLLDFGAARRVIGDMTKAPTVILKTAYAPIEQYGDLPELAQGAWTDFYALGSTLHYAIQGRTPPQAVARYMADRYEPLQRVAAGRYSDALLHTIDRMLGVLPQARPQDVAAVRALLAGDGLDDDRTLYVAPSDEATLPPAPRAALPAADAAPVPMPVPVPVPAPDDVSPSVQPTLRTPPRAAAATPAPAPDEAPSAAAAEPPSEPPAVPPSARPSLPPSTPPASTVPPSRLEAPAVEPSVAPAPAVPTAARTVAWSHPQIAPPDTVGAWEAPEARPWAGGAEPLLDPVAAPAPAARTRETAAVASASGVAARGSLPSSAMPVPSASPRPRDAAETRSATAWLRPVASGLVVVGVVAASALAIRYGWQAPGAGRSTPLPDEPTAAGRPSDGRPDTAGGTAAGATASTTTGTTSGATTGTSGDPAPSPSQNPRQNPRHNPTGSAEISPLPSVSERATAPSADVPAPSPSVVPALGDGGAARPATPTPSPAPVPAPAPAITEPAPRPAARAPAAPAPAAAANVTPNVTPNAAPAVTESPRRAARPEPRSESRGDAPAAEPATPSAPAPAATPHGASLPSPRCAEIIERVTLGEPLTPADRTILQRDCGR